MGMLRTMVGAWRIRREEQRMASEEAEQASRDYMNVLDRFRPADFDSPEKMQELGAAARRYLDTDQRRHESGNAQPAAEGR